MWHRNHRHNRISAGSREQVDCRIDLLRSTEWRCRLEQHQNIGTIRLEPIEGFNEIKEDIEHRCVIARQMRRAQERYVGTECLGRGRDVLIIGAHYNPREDSAPSGRVDGIGNERPTAEQSQILARNRLRTTSRRDDTKDRQY
jgi:hypothetical protein